MGKLDGKVVIVTGSSNGIGRATAVLFAEEGASVTIHGRSTETLNETEQILKSKGVTENRIAVVQGSIEEEKTCHELIEKTVEKFGKIDVLINNAGLGVKKGVHPLSLENYQYVFDVNLKSVVLLTQLATPYLEKTKGNIVNVSSIAALKASVMFPFYAMSKAALDHFCRCYSLILADKGIRINNLNPGGVETSIFDKSGFTKEQWGVFKNHVEENTPMKRFGTPEEMAKTMLFMATDATYMTGALIVADGGNTLFSPMPKLQ